MHAGITPFIIGLIYKSKWYKMKTEYSTCSIVNFSSQKILYTHTNPG